MMLLNSSDPVRYINLLVVVVVVVVDTVNIVSGQVLAKQTLQLHCKIQLLSWSVVNRL